MLKGRSVLIIIVSVIVSAVVPHVFFPSISEPKVRDCLSLLILAAMWWIAEPVPSYVTSLAIIPLCVFFDLLSAQSASAAFFDPVMFLFITGFSIAACMDKYKVVVKISAPIVSRILRSANRRGGDWTFYMGISLLCVVLSAVLSNVAAAVMVTAIGQSIAGTTGLDQAGRKRLFLTIAYACNVGGMIVPIASPQNLIAIAALQDGQTVSVVEWAIVSVPVCCVALVAIYIVLRKQYGVTPFRHYRSMELSEVERGPNSSDEEFSRPPTSALVDSDNRRWTGSQFFVLLAVATIVTGWCVFNQMGLDKKFQHMGIFGLAGIVLLHALGFLTANDWQSLPWAVLTLMGGGMVLGEAVDKSGLLSVMTESIKTVLPNSAWSWLVFSVLLTVIAVVANFLSSTVCALITMPILARMGTMFGHPKLFVISAALMTSGAMGLPVSSFPNASSASVPADTSKSARALLQVSDFTRTGFPVGFVILAFIVSGSYWLTTSFFPL